MSVEVNLLSSYGLGLLLPDWRQIPPGMYFVSTQVNDWTVAFQSATLTGQPYPDGAPLVHCHSPTAGMVALKPHQHPISALIVGAAIIVGREP